MSETVKAVKGIESESFEEILYRLLQAAPDDLDKSEGSIIYDALAPIALELFIQQEKFREILEQAFAVTAKGEYLDQIAEDHGLKRAPGESDESLRERILQQKRNPERGGAEADYVRWALKVTGTTYAKAIDMARGIGTVDVVVGGTIPDLVERVQEEINRRKPSGVDAVVRRVRMQTVPIIVQAIGIEAEKAKQAILDYTRTIGVGGTLYAARILSAVINAGAADASMVTPTENVILFPDTQIDPVVTIE